MMTTYKKLIIGAAVAGMALMAGAALANNTASMTQDEAQSIADKTEACAKVGTVKAFEAYNENSKTWWFTLNNSDKPLCNPACVVSAETKKAEVNWRCTGAIVPGAAIKTNKKTLDINCMAAAVAKREAAVSSAFGVKSSAISAALAKRAADLAAAWTKEGTKDRNAAIKAAWKAFGSAESSARKAFRTANGAAWKAFRTDAKTCHGSMWQDYLQQGTDNNL
jgi:hypothetical protein